MIQTTCKKCGEIYYFHNKMDKKCPWCEHASREVILSVVLIAVALTMIFGAAVLFP